MNTARSTVIGWGTLIAAAGISYIYAKREIDSRRREQNATGQRPAEIKDWKQRIEHPVTSNKDDTKSSPSDEGRDVAQPGKGKV